MTSEVDVAEIMVTLHPGHFARLRSFTDDKAVKDAMKQCHIYIIMARPLITASKVSDPAGDRIRYTSKEIGPFSALDFSHSDVVDTLDLHIVNGVDPSGVIEVAPDGSRLFVPVPGRDPREVDTSHLAALAAPTGCPTGLVEVGKWDVLYIGIAQGGRGRAAIDRLRSGHETLRRIYEDYYRTHEVHVVPVSIVHSAFIFTKANEPGGPAFDFDDFMKLNFMLTVDGRIETRELLLVVENALA
ncbi:hypothetical protein [Nocardia grenadensis]|uniref:hypothetical protein n=1 Tax=Nocardia grenadensis TaxID=931537 RepID=UPI003D93A9B4